jgi:hypothetical protein
MGSGDNVGSHPRSQALAQHSAFGRHGCSLINSRAPMSSKTFPPYGLLPQGNSPRDFFAIITRSTPIAIADIR